MSEESKDVPGSLDSARRVLRTANLTLADDDWISAINRAYYAIFYAANALRETEELERSKHSGALALFRQEYVQTGLIETEYSDIFGQAYEGATKATTTGRPSRNKRMPKSQSRMRSGLSGGSSDS